MDPNSMLLQDFIDAPSKAESILDNLTTEQIQLIEATINSVKKRKLTNSAAPPSPPSESEDTPLPFTNGAGTTRVSNTNIASNTLPQSTQSTVAAVIANALATAMSNAVANSLQQQQQQQQQEKQQAEQQVSRTDISKQQASPKPPTEPLAQVKNGVEWVSFVYSHNRVMKNYTIRTDLHTICLEDIDDKFKTENCVYPRANLPKDQYKGNRWSYETECNVLGWKLAWLNRVDISGKRGLIQRAVDSYRNRYPSMRSRRVARQAKLMNGTLRKRKQRGDEEDALMELMTSLATSAGSSCSTTKNNNSNSNNNTPASAALNNNSHSYVTPTTLDTAIVKPASHPKTIAMEDLATGARCRIKINVETVSLDYIPHDFRLANSPFPRHLHATVSSGRTRSIEEKLCNELAWKLAWLNPKILAGKKNMLQRAIDLYRTKFIPSMPPRKHSSRQSAVFTLMNNTTSPITPLTTSALSAQNAQYQQIAKNDTSAHTTPAASASPTMSCISGTTASLDFADCLSLADENTPTDFTNNINNSDSMLLDSLSSSESPHLPPSFDESSTTISTSSGTNSVACTPSPPVSSELFQLAMDEMYDAFMLPPTASVDDDDTFMFTNLDGNNDDDAAKSNGISNVHNTGTKLYDPSFLASPSLPSSTLQQDLLVKLENVDDFADQLLDSFF
ncbi:hypothetical protein BCR42DRAFT_401019 [Absidia repens]|uniref:DUF8032 domain-containing protein n=1 Tax=Absidia repens TaxID=90262 RepID=A0A1X2J210_9FUNG|nr:hypothetical protein BCR42DRAFT_401019 [Absidia repens]